MGGLDSLLAMVEELVACEITLAVPIAQHQGRGIFHWTSLDHSADGVRPLKKTWVRHCRKQLGPWSHTSAERPPQEQRVGKAIRAAGFGTLQTIR